MGTLRNDDAADRAFAEGYIREINEIQVSGKAHKGTSLETVWFCILHSRSAYMGQYLTVLKPWTRYLDPSQATHSLRTISKVARHLSGTPAKEIRETIFAVIVAVQHPATALQHLHCFLPIGIVSPFTVLLQTDSRHRNTWEPQGVS